MTYGFIGLGNMATAILSGMAQDGAFENNALCGFDTSVERMRELHSQLGLRCEESAAKVCKNADVILLAVKPQVLPQVLPQIAPELNCEKLVVSIAAGKPTAFYENAFAADVPVVRVMPNINARVRAAASAVCAGKAAGERHLEIVRSMFRSVGSVFDLPEQHFPAFGALGGASGAFIYLYIDALASSGVKAGLSRELSQQIASQVVLGSAKLVQASEEHPIRLCDQVCSPGGTTIEGIHTLKQLGFETAVQQAIDAIIEKDKLLGK